MLPPQTPPLEKVRLETLRSLNILDTPEEERYDRLTRMARRLFHVPISLVSLVDENRQWFKSCNGLDVRETPRDISFCGHAILGDNIFYIPDTTMDIRFADNPLVTSEPHIRFYAGCPLRSLRGGKMGTLCVIDIKPRNFSADDMETLRDLALMVERELAAVQLALLDELTDITNRRGFMTLAQNSLKLCARQGISASLVFIDLDNFKSINDTFGHTEGDRALVTFADEMRRQCRDSDLLARLGGDEFAILLADNSLQQGELAVARFRQAINERNRKENRGYQLSFSHGIVQFAPDQHSSVENLLAEGDALMYRHKKRAQGHGKVESLALRRNAGPTDSGPCYQQ